MLLKLLGSCVFPAGWGTFTMGRVLVAVQLLLVVFLPSINAQAGKKLVLRLSSRKIYSETLIPFRLDCSKLKSMVCIHIMDVMLLTLIFAIASIFEIGNSLHPFFPCARPRVPN